ncbi:YDG domain-containing protein, partial [Staphylococcus aureus]|uniref:YDG domain-containing protein n=1 Tax=Staphylococcus aureus TaxID=1280 RepID=UPI0039BE4188
ITAVITAGVTGTKVYDGNTSITLAGSDITFNGFLNGDKASASNGIAGTFATPNVGGQPLTATLNVNNMSVTCAAGGTACLGDYYYAGNATTGTGIAGDTLNSTAWTNGSASITAYGTGSIIAKNLYIT